MRYEILGIPVAIEIGLPLPILGNGDVVTGCNVESSSYGLTICAERVAETRAVAEGRDARDFEAITKRFAGSNFIAFVKSR